MLKAQSHEIASIANRKKETTYIYNINLLSIAELNFHELHFEEENVTVSEIERINYLNRFIINNVDQHARVDFIKLTELEKAVLDYNNLHLWNINFYKKIMKDFFDTIFSDKINKDFVLSKCEEELKEYLYQRINSHYKADPFPWLFLHKTQDIVEINITDDTNINQFLITDKKSVAFTRKWLKTNFKYDGEFSFVEWPDLPF